MTYGRSKSHPVIMMLHLALKREQIRVQQDFFVFMVMSSHQTLTSSKNALKLAYWLSQQNYILSAYK